MSYEFKKLSEVQALTEVPEGAKVLAEANGQIVRVPGSGLGGNTGIKTAIIKDSLYDHAVAGVQSYTQVKPEPAVTYSCINMTFEEAYETLTRGEPMKAHLMLGDGGYAMNREAAIFFVGTAINNTPCIAFGMSAPDLYWTADGLSTTKPGSGK